MDTTDKQSSDNHRYIPQQTASPNETEASLRAKLRESHNRETSLQQENDRLRLALEKKVDWERAAKAESRVAELELALSGKTGYDQVEVERERLRKAVTNEIAELERQVKGLAESPLMQFAAKDFERQAYEIGLLSGKCQWFLSLLSSPVSPLTNDDSAVHLLEE